MPRQMFTDELWEKLKVVMLKEGIYDKPLLRLTIEGIFYRLRVGIYPVPLGAGMQFISGLVNGLAKKN